MVAPAVDDVLDGLLVIDCDAHFTEPSDLWESRAPATRRDDVPVMRTVDGQSAWYLGGERWSSIGGNTISADGQKHLGGYMVQPFENVDEAAWNPTKRVELLDQMGVYAQILYPNGVGFASNHIFAIEDERQRLEVLRIYNDFLVDVQVEGKGRLLPQAMLPIWDMDATVAEMTRLVEQGVTGFTLSDRPELLGLPELPEPYFAPMWDIFNSTGTAANFHVAAGMTKFELEAVRNRQQAPAPKPGDPPPLVAAPAWRMFGPQRLLAITASQSYMSNVRIVVNLCMSDLFDRYPNLKIVSAESGIGWVPFLMSALEYQFDEMVTDEAEVGLSANRPTENFREHISVMFWFESESSMKLIEDVGVNNVLLETDVPHPTCLYPEPREHFARVLSTLTPEVRRRVVQDNAVELYNIELPTA